MIKTILHNSKTEKTIYGNEELLTEWANNPELWIWADFDNEEQEHERTLFLEIFGLDALVINDAQRARHQPKLEVFDDYFFLLVNGLDAIAADIDFKIIQMAFFISERFLITRRNVESVSIDNLWQEASNGNFDMSRGSTHVAYRILRLVTDRYTKLVEGIQSGLDEMEQEMFENPRDALLEDLISYGRNLKRLRRIFNYHEDLFARLKRKGHPFVDKQNRHEFIDVFEHTERLTSLTTLYKELADDLMNGYISISSHRLNQIMKVLTVVTTIFLPLTLMVGIYGMNFEYMPELKINNAYFILLSIMLSIVIGMLLFFRKIKWL